MANFLSKQFSDNLMTVIIDGKTYTIGKGHSNFNELVDAFNQNDADLFLKLLDDNEAFKYYASNGTNITIEDGCVKYYNKVVHNVVADIILDMRRQKHDIEYMVNFLDNLMQNPDANAIKQLYTFLTNRKMPITMDGCFIGYKTVLKNYFSKASGNLTLIQGRENSNGRIYNGIGEVIECLRSEVDNDPNNHCSRGLHVGALSYAGPGGWYNDSGDKVVLVKVNPKDAVSVPSDSEFTKLRVCKYEVVDDFNGELNMAVSETYSVSQNEETPEYDADEHDEDEDECLDCGRPLSYGEYIICDICDEEEEEDY